MCHFDVEFLVQVHMALQIRRHPKNDVVAASCSQGA